MIKAICISFSVSILYLWPIFKRIVGLFSIFRISLHIRNGNTLPTTYIANIFSPFCYLSFDFASGSVFSMQRLFFFFWYKQMYPSSFQSLVIEKLTHYQIWNLLCAQ